MSCEITSLWAFSLDFCCWHWFGGLTFLPSWCSSSPSLMMVCHHIPLTRMSILPFIQVHRWYIPHVELFVLHGILVRIFLLDLSMVECVVEIVRPFVFLQLVTFLVSGTIMTISKDRVKPSPMPDSWKLQEIFATGVVLGAYLAMMTVIFFWAIHETDFFPVWIPILSTHTIYSLTLSS